MELAVNMKKMIAKLCKTIEHQRSQLENMMSKDDNKGGSDNDSNSDESKD